MFRMEETDNEGAYCCEEGWEEVTYPFTRPRQLNQMQAEYLYILNGVGVP